MMGEWYSFYKFDEMAFIMFVLIAYLGICVASFAARYMRGDAQFGRFFVYFGLLAVSVAVMVSADSLYWLLLAFYVGHVLLVRLMIHKSGWQAAYHSGRLALINYSWSAVFITLAFILFYLSTGAMRVHEVIQHHVQTIPFMLALILLLVAAMMQSAIWPFHRWLLSSLNSPTPVSAIMHAGLINGGGFLLVRFAPLYLQHTTLLAVIFSVGMITAMLGSLWKLMQHDIKRMLACSTMGQMGFMFVQCGSGLFASAVAHLISHALFKAYLFLASSSAAQEQRFKVDYPPRWRVFIYTLVCGIVGSFAFGYSSGNSWFSADTTLVLMVIAFISASQLVIPLLQAHHLRWRGLWAVATATVTGFIYGANMSFITWVLEPLHLMQPQALNGIYVAGIIALLCAWLAMLLMRGMSIDKTPPYLLKSYVMALNASQPHPSTITTYRNHYQY